MSDRERKEWTTLMICHLKLFAATGDNKALRRAKKIADMLDD